MLAALLTTFFFALSSLLARRSIVLLGTQRANLARQLVALVLLGLWAHTLGQGLGGATFGLFFLSGLVGFGLGDWALFESLPRLGTALTVLLCQCLAAPIAALTEWLWLGTVLSAAQLAGSAVTLLGVALAVAPPRDGHLPHGHRLAGLAFGLTAALGQGLGAVLSRHAYLRAATLHLHLDGATTAYQRLWGGVLFIVSAILLRRLFHRPPEDQSSSRFSPNWGRGRWWALGNALAGPTLGVSCYQLALRGTPSSLVLPIVATTPLVVMLLAFAWEGHRPAPRTIVGSCLAVAGVVVLVLDS